MAVVTSSSKAPWRVLSVSFFASIYVFASATFAQDVVDDLTGFGPVIPSEAPVGLYEPRRIAWPLDMPWGVAFLPDGRILITERAGKLRVIENGSLMTQAIAGVPDVVSGGHSGLLDVLIDRNFEQNHRIFVSYTHGVSGAISMRVASAVL
ncbi:MAG TPA: PQQ-dependent sugar dehydrogenase, partial [Hyphomicrobium sp.]|nr:PQQ-dependent sugar dehydrogenase [Hyphomicrobium sp.]